MPGRKNKTGVPPLRSGDNLRVAKSDNKVKLFAKFNNKWYATPLSDAFEVTNQHDAHAGSILTFNRRNEGKLIPSISATKFPPDLRCSRLKER